ncbi:MAG: hypothetical protein KGQ68_07750 [Gammaproteobacteria bacterium]|nr:hypothetical protein [Gammaproteobacteria bacterium]
MTNADDSRTTGMGLWTDANNILQAVKLLVGKNKLMNVRYYLLGHGIEEALKAFIRANHGTLECLKSIGHDMEFAYDWANTCGLSNYCNMTTEDKRALSMLNRYYKSKELEYRTTGYKEYPPEDLLNRVPRKFIDLN